MTANYDDATADLDWDETWDEAYVEEDFNDETNYYTANEETDFNDETYLEVEQNFEEAYATTWMRGDRWLT